MYYIELNLKLLNSKQIHALKRSGYFWKTYFILMQSYCLHFCWRAHLKFDLFTFTHVVQPKWFNLLPLCKKKCWQFATHGVHHLWVSCVATYCNLLPKGMLVIIWFTSNVIFSNNDSFNSCLMILLINQRG